ncbi:MAG: gluconate 2-dehydrogenase subunit 3 family protein [Longimicrobiales bacterium]
MHRREVIRSLTAALALPFLRTAEEAAAIGDAVHRGLGQQPGYRTLDPAQQRLVETLADRILPATDSPGALDVQVPAFIDRLLTEWYEPVDAESFLEGLSAIDARAREAGGAPFAEQSEASQLELMGMLDAGTEDTSARRGFQQVKALTVYGYFTSERVTKEVLRTQIIFPQYDGCAPVTA